MKSPGFMSPQSKPEPQPKLNSIDPLFLFLSWLSLGSSLKHSYLIYQNPLCQDISSHEQYDPLRKQHCPHS